MTPLQIDRWHGAVRILFDAPHRRNALDLATVQGLHRALSDDPAAPAVLGSTDPTIFSAGADITVPDAERRQISDQLYACYRTMIGRPGPVLAVVEGPAVGGGAQLTTAADLRIAGPGARWRWVGPGHGLVVGGWILPSMVGRGRAMELMLTSRWVGADEAAAIGLAAAVSGDPWAEAARLLDELGGQDPATVARLKSISVTESLEALDAEQAGNGDWDGRAPRRDAATGRSRNG